MRYAWAHSLKFRLFWLGLIPPLLAFPILLAVLALFGGNQLNRWVDSQLNSNLSGAQNYLRVFRTSLQANIDELAKSERFLQLARDDASRSDINQALFATVRGSGFDFLLMVRNDGTVIGSSQRTETATKVPRSFVIQQAQVGVASSGYEQFSVEEIAALSPAMAQRLGRRPGNSPTPLDTPEAQTPNSGLLILAAAHLPLAVTAGDAVLVGGVLVNENTALIEHLREIIYPTGTLPDDVEGFAGIFSGQRRIVSSRLKTQDTSSLVLDAALVPVASKTAGHFHALGRQKIGSETFALAVRPIQDGEETTIGYLAVGFPIGPLQATAWLLLAVLTVFLGLVMGVVSIVYLRAGHQIVTQLQRIARALKEFREGHRGAQIQDIRSKDELGLLSHYVNDLLGLISQREKELNQMALHDALTGLANRKNFTDLMAFAMARSERNRSYAAVILLDLDNFKPLNDTYGHAAGDQLLIEVGRRLKSTLREVDTAARIGGDEFVVLLEALSEEQPEARRRALNVAQKIRAAIDLPFHIGQGEQGQASSIVHHCTASIGVDVFLGKTLDQTQILIRADAAMYQAKAAGRNRVCLYQEAESAVIEAEAEPAMVQHGSDEVGGPGRVPDKADS